MTVRNVFKQNVRKFVLLIAGLAFGVRLWGINFGLPYMYHPDEPGYVAIAQLMFKTGDLNPHFFNYPSLFFYLNAAAYIPYYVIGNLLGAFHSPSDILYAAPLTLGVGLSPMPTTFLLGRVLTAVFGTLSVVLAYLSGQQLTHNVKVGLLSGALVAVSWTNVANSRYVTPDTYVTCFALLALWASIQIYQYGRISNYIAAGVACGLVASTKYNGALIVVTLLAAHFLRSGRSGIKDRKLYAALILSSLAFLAATPFALVDVHKFLSDMSTAAIHYRTGHPGMEGDTINWYLSYLWQIEGPATLIAAIGVLAGLYRRSKELILVAVFPLAYFVFISSFVVRNERTLLPLLPFLFILAAMLVIDALEYALSVRAMREPAVLATMGVLVLCVAWPAWQTLQLTASIAGVDSRQTATTWIEQNLPPGSRVVLESYSSYVDPHSYSVQAVGSAIDHSLDWYISNRVDFVIFGQYMFGRYYAEPDRYASQVEQYDKLFQGMTQVKTFTDGGYDLRIYRVPTQTQLSN